MQRLSREDLWERVLDDIGRLAHEDCEYADHSKLQRIHHKLAKAWSTEMDALQAFEEGRTAMDEV